MSWFGKLFGNSSPVDAPHPALAAGVDRFLPGGGETAFRARANASEKHPQTGAMIFRAAAGSSLISQADAQQRAAATAQMHFAAALRDDRSERDSYAYAVDRRLEPVVDTLALPGAPTAARVALGQAAGVAPIADTQPIQRVPKSRTRSISAMLPEEPWTSPKGKFGGISQGISEVLGANRCSMDLNERHPFDVEIVRLLPRKTPYSFHSHRAQWEFYTSPAAAASVRSDGIEAGDAFLFTSIGESSHYPDSRQMFVRSPERLGMSKPRRSLRIHRSFAGAE